MIDITAMPTRILTSPFPIVTVDAAVSCEFDERQRMLLLVGNDRACLASLREKNMYFCKSTLQYHRTLTAGACRAVGSNGEYVYLLADAASSLTLHRFSMASHDVVPADHDSGTIFVGDAWDATPRIDHIAAVWNSGQADAVCTRRGEKGVAWAVVFEREEARRIKVDGSLERLFPQQQATPGRFVGAVANGVSFLSSTTGDTLVQFKLPKGTGQVEAVQTGSGGSDLYAVVAARDAVFVYDQRRAEAPVWSKTLRILKKTESNVDVGMLMAYCGEGVWTICAAEQLHCLRCITGFGVCRSFSLPDCFISPRFYAAGLCFSENILYIVGNKGA